MLGTWRAGVSLWGAQGGGGTPSLAGTVSKAALEPHRRPLGMKQQMMETNRVFISSPGRGPVCIPAEPRDGPQGPGVQLGCGCPGFSDHSGKADGPQRPDRVVEAVTEGTCSWFLGLDSFSWALCAGGKKILACMCVCVYMCVYVCMYVCVCVCRLCIPGK